MYLWCKEIEAELRAHGAGGMDSDGWSCLMEVFDPSAEAVDGNFFLSWCTLKQSSSANYGIYATMSQLHKWMHWNKQYTWHKPDLFPRCQDFVEFVCCVHHALFQDVHCRCWMIRSISRNVSTLVLWIEEDLKVRDRRFQGSDFLADFCSQILYIHSGILKNRWALCHWKQNTRTVSIRVPKIKPNAKTRNISMFGKTQSKKRNPQWLWNPA